MAVPVIWCRASRCRVGLSPKPTPVDKLSTVDGYWALRESAAVLNTGEFPLQCEGPDAEVLLNHLCTKDSSKVKPGRSCYGLTCEAEPHIGAEVRVDGKRAGRISAGAISPFLKSGIGMASVVKRSK